MTLKYPVHFTLPPSRFPGIDAFLYFSFLAIVCVHCLSEDAGVSVMGMVDHATRFGLPLLLIACGFFLGRSHMERPADTEGMLIDLAFWLAPVFFFWLAVYVVYAGQTASLRQPDFLLKMLVTGAPSFNLWLLPALGVSAAGIIAARRLGWGALFIIAGCFYIAGLAFQPYAALLGVPAFDTRNGPFFAFFFVLLGMWIARHDIVVPFETALAMAAGGLVLQIIEAYVLDTLHKGDFVPYDFLLGTSLYGAGMFFIARTMDGEDFIRAIAPLGRYVLGMFCIYPLFLWSIGSFFDINTPWQAASVGALTILCSTLIAVLMGQVPVLRRLAG